MPAITTPTPSFQLQSQHIPSRIQPSPPPPLRRWLSAQSTRRSSSVWRLSTACLRRPGHVRCCDSARAVRFLLLTGVCFFGDLGYGWASTGRTRALSCTGEGLRPCQDPVSRSRARVLKGVCFIIHARESLYYQVITLIPFLCCNRCLITTPNTSSWTPPHTFVFQ